MSIEQQITHLEELVTFDATIKRLSEDVGEKRGRLGGLREEVKELEDGITAYRASISEMEKTRSELVQEIRQVSTQVSRSRERLQRARNSREVNAAERELDELRKIQRDREEELRKLADLSEQARLSVIDSQGRKEELGATLEGTEEGDTQTIASLEAELNEVTTKRQDLFSKLPRMLQRRYDRLHHRGKVPVAKTHDGTCLGCFVKLPPMLFQNMLATRQLGECPNCKRILYYEPKPVPVEEDANEGEDAG
ncbi:MAG: C4-type zinc ribbon domain-containing protein [Myxococcota bacterium]